nr:bifunctional alpha/beta hydrolase/OsmC family protein [Pseudomonadota bacterium]
IKQQFLEDIEKTRLAEKISAMGKALLIFHSVADTTVGIENARKIYEAAKHPKSFISLDRADHLLSDKRDGVYVSDVLAAWAQRYLPAAQAAATDAAGVEQQAVDEDSTVVVESVGSGLAQKITNGKHELVADEPSSLGGSNTGPTPYGYLLSALGACTAITLRMYANLKKLPLTKVTVTLRHEKKHIEDCAECENKANKVDRITRVLKIEGDLSEEQRQRMLVIADKCPIHKTLNTPVIIETELEK